MTSYTSIAIRLILHYVQQFLLDMVILWCYVAFSLVKDKLCEISLNCCLNLFSDFPDNWSPCEHSCASSCVYCVHVHWVLYLITDFDLKLKFNVLNVLVVLPSVDIEYMWKQHAGGVKYTNIKLGFVLNSFWTQSATGYHNISLLNRTHFITQFTNNTKQLSPRFSSALQPAQWQG